MIGTSIAVIMALIIAGAVRPSLENSELYAEHLSSQHVLHTVHVIVVSLPSGNSGTHTHTRHNNSIPQSVCQFAEQQPMQIWYVCALYCGCAAVRQPSKMRSAWISLRYSTASVPGPQVAAKWLSYRMYARLCRQCVCASGLFCPGDAINRIIVRIQECKRLCCWFTPVSFRRDCCTHEWLRASAESIGLIVCIVCVCVPVYQNGRHGLDIIEMIVRVPNQLINTTVQTTAQTTTSISVNRHGITYYRVNTCQLFARPTQLSPIAWKHAQTQRPSKASFPFWFCRVTDWHVVISITNICRASIAVASNPSGLSQAAVPNMTGLSVRKTRRACEHIVCGVVCIYHAGILK